MYEIRCIGCSVRISSLSGTWLFDRVALTKHPKMKSIKVLLISVIFWHSRQSTAYLREIWIKWSIKLSSLLQTKIVFYSEKQVYRKRFVDLEIFLRCYICWYQVSLLLILLASSPKFRQITTLTMSWLNE